METEVALLLFFFTYVYFFYPLTLVATHKLTMSTRMQRSELLVDCK